MACCPTCGQAVPASKLLVCLQTNMASFRDATVKLTGREAEIAEVLRRAHPSAVRMETIIIGVYGGNADVSHSLVSVLISKLRPKLSAIGVTIHSARATGYRLHFSEAA